MDEDRLLRVLLALSATPGSSGSRLCTLSARLIAVSGAGITIVGADGSSWMTVCSSDEVARAIEDLQFTLGEGPGIDAYFEDHPVSEPDLSSANHGRWPGFAPAALQAGAVAVFGFPLRAGRARLGTLNLYRDRPGPLSPDQVADALVVAEVIAREILSLQAKAPAGSVAVSLSGDPGLRLVVHQATGMIAAQLDVDVGEALVRLRARAYSNDIPITTVATSVVERQIRFHRKMPPSGATAPGRSP